MQMRRSERAVTAVEDVTAILDKCPIARFGLVDDEGPYVVPVNFAYKVTEGRLTIYAHGAAAGRKLAAIAVDARCCVEADYLIGLAQDSPGACGHTSHYESVIGFGRARLVDDPAEAREALRLLVVRQAPDQADTLPAEVPSAVAVIAVDLDTVMGKANRPVTG